jgi:hypothetical protein
MIVIAKAFPASRFTGYDLCAQAVDQANSLVADAGQNNIFFAVKNVAEFTDRETFDQIFTFDAIHDRAVRIYRVGRKKERRILEAELILTPAS